MTSTEFDTGLGTRTWVAPAVFTLTVLTSASLLFFVQPLFTRIVLPHIGGAPAVWTTAMLFFQTVLIAGYLYAHLSARYLPPLAQAGLHVALWASALVFLPLSIPADWRYDATAAAEWQTLALYAAGVGLPFMVLSANAPLLQAWYARTNGPSASDPYFLYGASNFGSLVALLAFPLAAEPLFGLTDIGAGWALVFLALGPMFLACGLLARSRAPAGSAAQDSGSELVSWRRLGLWAFLAFVPSSLMLGVTTRLTTDLGSIPLLWVVPLALYLISFIIAFMNRDILSEGNLRRLLTVSLIVTVVLTSGLLEGLAAGLLLAGFFGVAVVSHRLLYLKRPGARHLTIYYVTMSVGGALGGLFNSMAAPLLFDRAAELPITAGLAVLLLAVGAARPARTDLAHGLIAGAIAVLPISLAPLVVPDDASTLAFIGVAAVLAVSLQLLRNRPAASATAALATLVVASLSAQHAAVFRDRSFFGAHEVVEKDGLRIYRNGTTVHGAQRIADDGRAPAPLTYYTAGGPMGQIMSSTIARDDARIGIIGLGVGSLACYSRGTQDWHFYEIDAAVDRIARNPALFGYVSACAPDAPTHLGDARIVLAAETPLPYDILVVDAYSSDAVPVHLTTIEALTLYRDRLAPGGIVVFHISNRFYAIDRPLGRGAEALGLKALIQRHDPGSRPGDLSASATTVVAMGLPGGAIDELAADDRWQPLASDGGPLWTDDHANPLAILN